MPKRSGVGKAAAGQAELFCYCNGPDNGTPMIECGKCAKWYHGACIGLKSGFTLDDVDLFHCGCGQKKITYKGSANAGADVGASSVAGEQASTSKEEPQGNGSNKNLVENNGRKTRSKKAHDRV